MKLPSGPAFDGLMRLREMALIPATRSAEIQYAINWLNDLRETYDRTVGLYPSPDDPRCCRHCRFWRNDPVSDHNGPCCELYELTASHDQPPELLVKPIGPAPELCPWRRGFSVIMHAGPITEVL